MCAYFSGFDSPPICKQVNKINYTICDWYVWQTRICPVININIAFAFTEAWTSVVWTLNWEPGGSDYLFSKTNKLLISAPALNHKKIYPELPHDSIWPNMLSPLPCHCWSSLLNSKYIYIYIRRPTPRTNTHLRKVQLNLHGCPWKCLHSVLRMQLRFRWPTFCPDLSNEIWFECTVAKPCLSILFERKDGWMHKNTTNQPEIRKNGAWDAPHTSASSCVLMDLSQSN